MNQTDVEIRFLHSSDSLAALTELLHRSYAPLAEMGLNFRAVGQTVADTLDRATRGVCFVAAGGRDLVGTISLWPPQPKSASTWYHRADVASAHQFAVAPEWQRRGLGSQILVRAEAWAREAGYAELAVDTAIPATHLVDFYTRRGFRQVEVVTWTRRNYQSVVLSKSLAAHGQQPGTTRS